jgi:hypothetical protein
LPLVLSQYYQRASQQFSKSGKDDLMHGEEQYQMQQFKTLPLTALE